MQPKSISELKLLADECLFRITIEVIKSLGAYVVRIQDIGLAGANDQAVYR